MTAANIAQPPDSRDPSQSTLTSLAQLFDQTINGMRVKAIEIPLFQRDYAQGRHSQQAELVRTRFIADLCAALDSDPVLHLDFVFGDVVEGTLYPLDGQQRLTTLFLLHCYLAWHQQDQSPHPWHAFHYATRPGARKFCEFLTKCRPDMATENLSAWLRDQARYLPTWKHDPTIQGMLVVLDAFHEHYRGRPQACLDAAWIRLTKKQAIRFLLLPVAAQKLDNTLYVKMNSRGRPLTEFENFKAELEALLHRNPAIDPADAKVFSGKVDTDWSDLFWSYRRDGHLIDEEFMRYLRFLMEVRAWRRGQRVQTKQGDLQALMSLSTLLLDSEPTHAREDFAWIMQALDIWLEAGAAGIRQPRDVAALFSKLFTRKASSDTTPLRIFNFRDFDEALFGVDLFHACCALYGTRSWKLPHTVLFYGVLQGLLTNLSLPNLHSRLRLLRNLIEASEDEIRADDTRNNMPALLSEVDTLMADGPLADVKTFNKVQVRNEQAKRALVAQHPSLLEALNHLEDHELLRGGLTVFELTPTQDPAIFIQRAAQFFTLFDGPTQEVGAALLAKGHEGRIYRKRNGYRFTYLGATKPRQTGLWEDHLRARYNEDTHPSSTALMALLDEMASGSSVETVVNQFIRSPNTRKDWRYYLASYACMRSSELEFAGNFAITDSPGGYAICIPKTDSCDGRSYHYDAYLLALVHEAGIKIEHIGNENWPRCFPGDESQKRHLRLRRSGLQICCIENGWELSEFPTQDGQLEKFNQLVDKHRVVNGICSIEQADDVDTRDRIEIGSSLLRDLVEEGF